jgi:hypothetical protein
MSRLIRQRVFQPQKQVLTAAGQKFVKHPDWIALKSKPEYADKKILCGITNILLKPAPWSQIGNWQS